VLIASVLINLLCGVHIKESGSVNMSFVEKMDVLDLIIETLKEHERALSEIVYKLDACLNGERTEEQPIRAKETSLENWR